MIDKWKPMYTISHRLLWDWTRGLNTCGRARTATYHKSRHLTTLLFLCCRLPRGVLRFHSVCHRGARPDMGTGPFLWPLHMREARRWRDWSLVGARGGLRPLAQTQPQVQTLWKNQQDRYVPWLLPHLRVWGRGDSRIPRDPHSGSPTSREEGRQGLIYPFQWNFPLHSPKITKVM